MRCSRQPAIVVDVRVRSWQVRWLGAQLFLGLEALHAMRVLHRDVKPSNVLMRHDGYISLTDFGLCAQLDTDEPITGKTGTPATTTAQRRKWWKAWMPMAWR